MRRLISSLNLRRKIDKNQETNKKSNRYYRAKNLKAEPIKLLNSSLIGKRIKNLHMFFRVIRNNKNNKMNQRSKENLKNRTIAAHWISSLNLKALKNVRVTLINL